MPDGSRGSLLARSLVGRDVELGALQDAWRTGGSTWVVTAAAGVGKSRLARELASWAQTTGGLVLVGRCSPTGQDTPLRPWREALLVAARAGRTPGATLEPFVPALARVVPEWGAAADDPSPLVLGEAVLRLLSSWATPTATTLLVIEDLHWADPESLEVLEYVVDNVAGAPLLVVATRREGESGAGADLARDLVARRAALALPLDAARQTLRCSPWPTRASTELTCPRRPPRCSWSGARGCRSSSRSCSRLRCAPDGTRSVTTYPGRSRPRWPPALADLPPAARPLLTTAALLGRNFDWPLAASRGGTRRRRGRRAPAAGRPCPARRRRGGRLPVPTCPHP